MPFEKNKKPDHLRVNKAKQSLEQKLNSMAVDLSKIYLTLGTDSKSQKTLESLQITRSKLHEVKKQLKYSRNLPSQQWDEYYETLTPHIETLETLYRQTKLQYSLDFDKTL